MKVPTFLNLNEEVDLTEAATHVYEEVYLQEEYIHDDVITPKSYQQAISLLQSIKWREAMDKEMASIKAAGTFELVSAEKASHLKVLQPIWMFKIKFDGTYKARLCFPGHRQTYGVDYYETESPTAHFTTFCIFIVIATTLGEGVNHFDMPSVFLNRDLAKIVYMR